MPANPPARRPTPSPASKPAKPKKIAESPQGSQRSAQRAAQKGPTTADPGFQVPYHRSPAKERTDARREARMAARHQPAAADADPAPSAVHAAAQPADAFIPSSQEPIAHPEVVVIMEPASPSKPKRKKHRKAADGAPTSAVKRTGSAAEGPPDAAAKGAGGSAADPPSCARMMAYDWESSRRKRRAAGILPAAEYAADFAANAAARAAAVMGIQETHASGSLGFSPSRASTHGGASGLPSDDHNGAGMCPADGVLAPAVDEHPAYELPEGLLATGTSTPSTTSADIAQPPAQTHAAFTEAPADVNDASAPHPQAGVHSTDAVDGALMGDAEIEPNAAEAGNETTADEDDEPTAAQAAAGIYQDPDAVAGGSALNPSESNAGPPGSGGRARSSRRRSVEAAQVAGAVGKRPHKSENPDQGTVSAAAADKQPKHKKKKRRGQVSLASTGEHSQEQRAAADPAGDSKAKSKQDKKSKKGNKTRALADLQEQHSNPPSGLDVLAEQASLQEDAGNEWRSRHGALPAEGTSEGPQEGAATSPAMNDANDRAGGNAGDAQPTGASDANQPCQLGAPSEAASAGGAANVAAEESHQAGPSKGRARKRKSAAHAPYVEYRHYADGRKYQERWARLFHVKAGCFQSGCIGRQSGHVSIPPCSAGVALCLLCFGYARWLALRFTQEFQLLLKFCLCSVRSGEGSASLRLLCESPEACAVSNCFGCPEQLQRAGVYPAIV